MKYFIKIIFVLLIITSLFGRNKWEQDPVVLRQIYVLNENYMKHFPNQIEWKSERQVLLIHSMQQAMRKIEKGKYSKNKSPQILFPDLLKCVGSPLLYKLDNSLFS